MTFLKVVGIVLGAGLSVKVIDYLIAWARERREQRNSKTTQEKDRPRFRIDISKIPTTHTHIPAARVKILSLGSLPLTINEGEVFIEAQHYPERVKTYQLKGREINSISPIEVDFPLPPKLTNPLSIGKPIIKMICEFSYGKDNQKYRYENIYNCDAGWFE